MNSTRRALLQTGLGCAMASPWPAWAAEPQPPLRITVISRYVVSWIVCQLLTRVYEQAGIGLSLVMQPNVRAGMSAQSGAFDGEATRIFSYGNTHPELIRVEPPIYPISIHSYSLRRNKEVSVRSREDLARYSVTTPSGMHFANELVAGHKALTRAQSPDGMFLMLKAGRVQAVLDTSMNARRAAIRHKLDLVESPELAHFDTYHFLHQRHAALVPILGAAIRKLQTDGTLAALAARSERVAMTLSDEQFD